MRHYSEFSDCTCQVVPMLPRLTTAEMLVPCMAHAPRLPRVSSQRMEAMPVPLKSPVVATFHPAGIVAEISGFQDADGLRVYVKQPHSDIVGTVLKEDVGGAVAIKVTDSDDLLGQRYHTEVR